jgi:NADPH-dependent 2,4-dienoyl-CoA reductase/sulfur reductase-like enzyme
MKAFAAQEVSPQVVIVGGGFGGLSTAKEPAGKGVRVTIIDRTNHHLFQPLLYQVATAGLSPADIAQPILHILKDARNIEVVLGEVDRIDTHSMRVRTTDNLSYAYDYLILAGGARRSHRPGSAGSGAEHGHHRLLCQERRAFLCTRTPQAELERSPNRKCPLRRPAHEPQIWCTSLSPNKTS